MGNTAGGATEVINDLDGGADSALTLMYSGPFENDDAVRDELEVLVLILNAGFGGIFIISFSILIMFLNR